MRATTPFAIKRGQRDVVFALTNVACELQPGFVAAVACLTSAQIAHGDRTVTERRRLTRSTMRAAAWPSP